MYYTYRKTPSEKYSYFCFCSQLLEAAQEKGGNVYFSASEMENINLSGYSKINTGWQRT